MVFFVLKFTTDIIRGKLVGGIPRLYFFNSLQQYSFQKRLCCLQEVEG